MSHPLLTSTAEYIGAALRRKAIRTASKWATSYRMMGGKSFPGPWTFKYHPWLREMHDCESELVVGRKAAQMGFTEWGLNKTFFTIDILKGSVLYILPASTPDASDFSTSRFAPALEMSPHLEALFSDVSNVGHKRAGSANLFIRGSRSRSQLKSLPVDLIIADEVAEMNQANLELAFERVSGQRSHQIMLISTPTLDDMGIDTYYKESTQKHFHFTCPACGRATELLFPECLVITAEEQFDPKLRDSHLICKECQAVLPHETKHEWLKDGYWQPAHADRTIDGYHINQLYSPTVRPDQFAALFLKAEQNPTAEQEFYNSKLGQPHVVEGARVTDAVIEACTKKYTKLETGPRNAFITMGVDIGKRIHYEVDQWFFSPDGANVKDINSRAEARLIAEGSVREFEDLDPLLERYRVNGCVVDAQPERRKALEFANRHGGRVKLCFYGTIKGKGIQVTKDEEQHTVSVERVTWMDTALGRFHSNRIDLPVDLSQEYKRHIKAPARVYTKDKDDNPIGRYEKKENEPDHLAHARTYAELALPIGLAIMNSQNVTDLWR